MLLQRLHRDRSETREYQCQFRLKRLAKTFLLGTNLYNDGPISCMLIGSVAQVELIFLHQLVGSVE